MPLTTVDRHDPRSPRAVGSYVSAVLLTLLLATACTSHAAGTAASPASSGTGTSSPPSQTPAVLSAIASTPTSSPSPSPSRIVVTGNKVVVTQADQGKTFQVSIGAIIEFDLHADGLPTGTTVESAHTSDTTTLQKLTESAGPGPNSTGVYRAIGPGTAYVIAGITTPCPTAPATPCAVAEEAYAFHVQVVPPK